MDPKRKQQLAQMMANIKQGALFGQSISQLAQKQGLPQGGPLPGGPITKPMTPLPGGQPQPQPNVGTPGPNLRFSLFAQALEALGHKLDINKGKPTAPLIQFQSDPFLASMADAGKATSPNKLIFSKPMDSSGEAVPLNPSVTKPQFTIDPRATPLSRAVFAPMNDQTKPIVDRAASIFAFTPAFKDDMNAAQPVADKPAFAAGLKDGRAAAEYQPGYTGTQGNDQKLTIGPGYGSSPMAVAHEGLHAAWFTTPGLPGKFVKAYNANTTPEIQNYLAWRMQDYKGLNPAQLNNLSKMPERLQTEVHSFLSEYPTITGKPLPAGLENYYRQFVDPNNAMRRAIQRYRVKTTIQQAIGDRGYNTQDE